MRQGLTIEVPTDKLLAALKANRDLHVKNYEKAKKGWARLMRKQLESLLADLNAGQSIPSEKLHLDAKPTHFVKEYDEAIAMLNFSSNTTVEINQDQYRAYVNDEWSWKIHWEASNTTYIAAGA